MAALVEATVIVRGSPTEIWAVIGDPAALARVLPGAEHVEMAGPDAFRGVLAAKIQFMTIRADVTATFHDAEPARRLRLVIEGRPRGLAGTFTATIPFALEPLPAEPGNPSATRIDYAIDLTTSGRLAAFGAPLLRDTMRRQVAALVANLDGELESRRAEAREPADPGSQPRTGASDRAR